MVFLTKPLLKKPQSSRHKSTTVLHRKYPVQYTVKSKLHQNLNKNKCTVFDQSKYSLWPYVWFAQNHIAISRRSKNGLKTNTPVPDFTIFPLFTFGMIHQNPAKSYILEQYPLRNSFFQNNRDWVIKVQRLEYWENGGWKFFGKALPSFFLPSYLISTHFLCNTLPQLITPIECTNKYSRQGRGHLSDKPFVNMRFYTVQWMAQSRFIPQQAALHHGIRYSVPECTVQIRLK